MDPLLEPLVYPLEQVTITTAPGWTARWESRIQALNALDQRIQALPQELQDMILKFLHAQVTTRTFINNAYKPPPTLQLNRKLRTQLSENYYRDAVFTITVRDERGYFWTQTKPCRSWMSSLTEANQKAIRTILVRLPRSYKTDTTNSTSKHSWNAIRGLFIHGRDEHYRRFEKLQLDLDCVLRGDSHVELPPWLFMV